MTERKNGICREEQRIRYDVQLKNYLRLCRSCIKGEPEARGTFKLSFVLTSYNLSLSQSNIF